MKFQCINSTKSDGEIEFTINRHFLMYLKLLIVLFVKTKTFKFKNLDTIHFNIFDRKLKSEFFMR